MTKKILILFLIALFSFNLSYAQRKLGVGAKNIVKDDLELNDSIFQGEKQIKLSGKTKYTDYKIISHHRDTTVVDTTLSIKKEYKFNFLRKDNFELLEFHNQGQTFNNLGYSFNENNLFPDIGYRAKQFSSYDIEDIKYYQVPTPTSEILYRSGIEQGQVLESFFTANISKRLNFSLSYKGIRSLGQYRQALISQGNFRVTMHYTTKENQYSFRTHYVTQDLFSQESGGLTPESLANFISDDVDFQDRGRLDVNLNDTENNFNVTRFYFEHDYKIFSSKDSISDTDFTNLKIGHILSTETKEYNFIQTSITESFFGNASASGAVKDKVEYVLTNNQAFLEFNSKYVLGTFKVKTNYTNYNYGYNAILNGNSGFNTSRLRGNAVSVGADWQAKLGIFNLNAEANLTPGSSRLAGNYLKGEAFFEKDSIFKVSGSLLISSKSPNFNFQYHQSRYDDYNWENNLKQENTRDLGFALASKWLNTSLNFTNIDNYTFFDENSQPQQFGNQITYLKAKVNREFTFGKFALDNTLMYQNVSSGSSVFKVPDFVTRNTIYYSDYWFKGKPMKVNIGVTFKYFTDYEANAYDPLLGEFTLQNATDIGYPTFDVFFNAQVRRTRLFLKIENVTSDFSKKNYFSAPNYPYRDFAIRFGLVWNWFI